MPEPVAHDDRWRPSADSLHEVGHVRHSFPFCDPQSAHFEQTGVGVGLYAVTPFLLRYGRNTGRSCYRLRPSRWPKTYRRTPKPALSQIQADNRSAVTFRESTDESPFPVRNL